jgi:DNA-binding CsgD family transcriptional regulator/predicted ester cyclase
MSPTEPDSTFEIEQNGHDWIVARDGATVSVHPNREEAERAVEWLVRRSVVGDHQSVRCGDLTPREIVVLQRLKYRGSYTEIARELFVSTNTVKTHVRNVYAKLGVTNRTSALAAATVLGLLDARNGVRDGQSADVSHRSRNGTADATRKYMAAFAHSLSTHDWTAYARVLRHDVRQTTPVMTGEGIDDIIAFNERVIAAIPDIRIEARHVTVDPDGNRAILECLHSGTATGELTTRYGVLPATGKRFEFGSVHIVTFDESGLVSEIRRYWDLYELLRDQGIATSGLQPDVQ